MNKTNIHSPALIIKLSIVLVSLIFIVLISGVSNDAYGEVKLQKLIKISDSGLYFDGAKVSKNAKDSDKYDFVFGRRITPHGDCIKVYKGYVFMTWYHGDKKNRHVMLSRYNPNTGQVKTIQFPHRHTGFQNKPHLGESHNTIAVGISPIDDTLHLLYDMHSYSQKRPADGSFANDYFRYSYSNKGAATVSDEDFTLERFVKSSNGTYKHLEMRKGVNYRALTYPNFFTNTQGELFMWIRKGGHNNGAYKFAKYDGDTWSDFTQFNILSAKQKGNKFNWGLYGDIKFESGKIRIGFHTRIDDDKDKFMLNNGFYYASSDDPEGKTGWKNYKGESVKLPVIDPSLLKITEPGDAINVKGENTVSISRGADWTVTDRGDIHLVTTVASKNETNNIHTFINANDKKITTTKNLSDGKLHSYKNDIYLVGLENDRVFIDKASGGTNNWNRVYMAPETSKRYRFGNIYISEGKLYYFLMEKERGSAQPLYLQIIDLYTQPNISEVVANDKN